MREPNPYHSSRSCVYLPTELRYHLSRPSSTTQNALFSFWKILSEHFECPLIAPLLFDLTKVGMPVRFFLTTPTTFQYLQYCTRSKRELRLLQMHGHLSPLIAHSE